MDFAIGQLHALVAQSPGQVTYRGLCERSLSVPSPPRFAFGDAPHDLMQRYYHETLTLPVGLYTAAGIDLFNTSLLLHQGAVLRCDEIHMDAGTLPHFTDHYRTVAGSTRIRTEAGQRVLLIGVGSHIYGHWLVDFLPKLFVLHLAGYDVRALHYLVPAETPDFGIALLDLLGIGSEQRVVFDQDHEIIRAEQLLIPTMVRTNSRTAPLFREAIRFVVSLIWDRNEKPVVMNGASRIFVSRARVMPEQRQLLNRERIEELAAAAGFAIVHPEQLPLLEQFALFSQASHILGEYGSALHASLFSPPGTVVGLLRGSGSPVAGFLQSAIGAALDQPTGYVFGAMAEDDPTEAFTIAEDALQTCLALIFSGMALA